MEENNLINYLRTQQRSLFIPLMLAEAYLFGTFILFLVSPLCDKVVGLSLLIGFVMACNLALWAGYYYFFSKTRAGANSSSCPLGMMRWVIIVGIVWVIASEVQIYHDQGDINTSLVTRLANPGDSYLTRRQIIKEGVPDDKPVSRIGQIQVCTSVLSFCTPVFAILIWPRLGWLLKVGSVVAMLSVVVVAMSTGTNEQFGHLALIVISALLIRRYGLWPASRKADFSSRNKLYALAAVGIISLFMLFMGNNLEDRVNSRRSYDPDANMGDISGLDFLPKQMREQISMVWFYPCHGYLGLSYALAIPFEWTRGVGSARGIQAYLKQYLGVDDILERTYPFRAEEIYHWPALGYWWTLYPWLASDITFPGVIVFMFGLGWAFAKTWYESTRLNDPFAGVVFVLIFITIAFVPANFQLLIAKQGLWTVFGGLSVYGFSKMFGGKTSSARRSPVIRNRLFEHTETKVHGTSGRGDSSSPPGGACSGL